MQKPAARKLHGAPRVAKWQSIIRLFAARAPSLGSASVVFFGAISQCRAALFDEPLKFAAHVLACGIRSFQILLQAVHVIDAGTDLRERGCIARGRPQTGQEVSGNKAERERDKKA